jgi:hypothetical protein
MVIMRRWGCLLCVSSSFSIFENPLTHVINTLGDILYFPKQRSEVSVCVCNCHSTVVCVCVRVWVCVCVGAIFCVAACCEVEGPAYQALREPIWIPNQFVDNNIADRSRYY